MSVMLPKVHLNGTSREELVRQYEEARTALQTAIEAVQRAAPHGRDYYLYGGRAIIDATDQHVNRLHRLGEVLEELTTISESLITEEAPGVH